MINVAQARAELANIETETVQVTKAQYGAMLTAIERGQAAERTIVNVRSQLNALGPLLATRP